MSNPYGPNAGSAVYEFLNNMVDGASDGDVPQWNSTTEQYDPTAATDIGAYPEVVPATEMNAVSATAGENANSGIGIPVVSFADASTQRANGTKRLPSDWSTVDVKLKFTHPSTGSGDVIWRFYSYLIGDSDKIDSSNGDYTNHGNVTVTAPAEDTSGVVTLKSGLSLTSGKSVGWTLYRRGSDAGDTLAEAAEAIELIFERAS